MRACSRSMEPTWRDGCGGDQCMRVRVVGLSLNSVWGRVREVSGGW